MRGIRNFLRMIPRRGVSDYSKRFGYEVKDPQSWKRLNAMMTIREKVDTLLCFGIGFSLIYAVMRDRRLHYEAFSNNKSEGIYFSYDYKKPPSVADMQNYPALKMRND